MAARPFPELMMPAEVARAFRVHPRTVERWAREGKLRMFRTLGQNGGPGHRRYFRAEVDALLAGRPLTGEQLDALIRGDA